MSHVRWKHEAWLNPEKRAVMSVYRAEWHKKNIEKRKAQIKAWKAANPDRVRMHKKKREELMRKNGGNHTRQQFREKCESLMWKCWYCRCELSVHTAQRDHLKSVRDGGTNDIENIVPCCARCNNRKKDKSYVPARQP